MKTKELLIDGMSCGHCVMAVRKELDKLTGVGVADVQIGTTRITIDETKVSQGDLASAIARAGYVLKEIR